MRPAVLFFPRPSVAERSVAQSTGSRLHFLLAFLWIDAEASDLMTPHPTPGLNPQPQGILIGVGGSSDLSGASVLAFESKKLALPPQYKCNNIVEWRLISCLDSFVCVENVSFHAHVASSFSAVPTGASRAFQQVFWSSA